MSHGHIWFVIIAIGLVTFFWRFVFIALIGRIEEPKGMRPILRLVPASVLAALVVSGLFLSQGRFELNPLDAKYPAAIIAAMVAWRTKNLFWTIASGMLALWTVRWCYTALGI